MAPGDAPRMRPAHPNGPTFLAYTPNGRRLVTAGSNDTIRIFETDSDSEPVNIHDCPDGSTAVIATNEFFIVGAEDGSASLYSLQTNAFDRLLARCSLPVRDLALSADEQWVAVASDELEVKVVNVNDITRVRYLREQQKPVKHLSFDPSGRLLTVSCTDGVIYVYAMDDEEPEVTKKLDGVIKRLETENQASAAVVWHPDGRAFAAATATREVQTVSKRDWEKQRAFGGQHQGDITALVWSPNGALLVTAASDKAMVVWDTKTQKKLEKYDIRAPIWAFAWHPTENILSYTDDSGSLYIHTDFLPDHLARHLKLDLQPAPFIHDPLGEVSGNAGTSIANQGLTAEKDRRDREAPPRRQGTPDSLDEILGPDDVGSLDGFVEDDEADGYEGVNGHGKRSNGHLEDLNGHPAKRRAQQNLWQPRIHDAFQPGSTPWRGNRRYLCLNLLGFVWTVDQDTHHTITVEFYDREFQRDFHFTDPYKYDKACLSEKGTLFSCQPAGDQPAMIHYRPHETWTTRADWRTMLPKGEGVVAIALSQSFVVVTTTTNYVRVYTLFGTPVKVYRQKSSPIVTCATWRDYVLTIGNGSVGGDGQTRLLYTIENVRRDEVCQSEDVVALTEGAQLRNVFFSDTGDPCIYDTTGVLLVLQHWRTTGQARWIPLLDTKLLSRLASGRKTENYWPVAVAQEKFYCIILKGGDRHPYFPRPLLNEFDFHIPLHHAAGPKKPSRRDEDEEMNGMDDDEEESEGTETTRLEHSYALTTLLQSLTSDLVAATTSTAAQRATLASQTLQADKLLLQLLAAECVEGEERGMKALEIVGLMKDESGKIMDAAAKVASRFGREVLRSRIEELAERRAVGLHDDRDDEM